ncbi:MAG TPA: N-acetylglucosamine-6-phosphate deacetylase [Patescibacteria group bacterium]|nr:N-acetylglucosamine-6-phosphate deacetylase [Patescibacteria group bacterium]
MVTEAMAIYNARLIAGDTILTQHTLVFDRQIRAIFPDRTEPCRPGDRLDTPDGPVQLSDVLDAQNHYLSPGFIDLHIHGCAGSDAMDEDREGLQQICHGLPQTGVTAFLPTTMTMAFPQVTAALQRIRRAMSATGGARILGCHLEGPFISENYKGAQDAAFVRAPDYSLIAPFQDAIKIVTVAPEIAGSLSFIRECTDQGILAAIGHSGATYEETQAALTAGAAHFTHTFNAASPFNHRSPGVTGAALDSAASCELIADNIHVHPAAQRILLTAKGPERVILVTDAMRACLMGDGEFDLGGQPVTVKNGQARLASGVIAGSVLTLNRAVRHFIANTALDLPAAVRLVTANPANRIGFGHCKGHLQCGYDADLTLFDDEFHIRYTFVSGQKEYAHSEVRPCAS